MPRGAVVLDEHLLLGVRVVEVVRAACDHDAMLRSLRTKVLPLADDTVVYPGHGPETMIGMERASNPYLLQVAGEEPFAPGHEWGL